MLYTYFEGTSNQLPDRDFADLELCLALGWSWQQLHDTPAEIVDKARLRFQVYHAVQNSKKKGRG